MSGYSLVCILLSIVSIYYVFQISRLIIERKEKKIIEKLKVGIEFLRNSRMEFHIRNLRYIAENEYLKKRIEILIEQQRKKALPKYKAGQQIKNLIFLSKETKVNYKVYFIDKDCSKLISEKEFNELIEKQ